MAPVQKKVTCCKKMIPVAKKCHPQKSYLHNIKLYDFYLKIIHLSLIFLNKYLVVV